MCLLEAARPEFRAYASQVVANAQALADQLQKEGFRVVSGGTDTHLMLVDVFSQGIRGKEAENALHAANITVNKNAIPFDVNPPMNPSGIRLGTPALTTRGMGTGEMRQIGVWIAQALHHRHEAVELQKVQAQVRELAQAFPLYPLRRSAGQAR